MRRKNSFIFAIVLLSFLSSIALRRAQNPVSGTAQSPQVIGVTGKKYEFLPCEIRVKKGARVQLKLRTDDSAHGLKLDLYPEGTRNDGNPGFAIRSNTGQRKGEEGSGTRHRVRRSAHGYL
jgi:hypothetical protein